MIGRAEGSNGSAALWNEPVVPLPDSDLFANRPHCTPSGARGAIFADDLWPIHYLSFASNGPAKRLDFAAVPASQREAAKIYMYNVINTEPQRRSPYMKSRFPAAGTIESMFFALKRLLEWIDATDRGSLASLTARGWDEYGLFIGDQEDLAQSSKAGQLLYLARLWAHNVDLPESLKFPAPTWFAADKLSRWLGPARKHYENRTEPFHPDAISALVNAAVRVIDGYLDGSISMNSGARRHLVEPWFREQGLELPQGHVSGRNWERWKAANREAEPFDQRHLRAAAFILVSYFTGMRPNEVLHLRRGCLIHNDVESSGSKAVEYAIVGSVFKGRRDEYGDHVSGGEQRDQPWVTIAPAARAIEALERLGRTESPYLFALFRKGWSHRDARRVGDVVTTRDMARGLGEFVRRWNQRAEATGELRVPVEGACSLLPSESDGSTPAFSIATRRFRRTLAYHIANRPGGEIALGIQYGHVRSVVTLGYAGRAESGFPDEVELETLLTSWDELAALGEELHGGSGLSGPASRRVRDGLDTFNREFAGKVRTLAELGALKRSGLTLIHDNEKASNICAYVAATALCHPSRVEPDKAQTPDLTNCQRGCPNIALLDSHIEEKRRIRDRLVEEQQLLPLPLAARNQQIAHLLTKEVERHDSEGLRHDSTRE